jgi:hypothetical protein
LEQVLPEGSALKIRKGYDTPVLVPGADNFQIKIGLYSIKLRYKPEHIQKLQPVTN